MHMIRMNTSATKALKPGVDTQAVCTDCTNHMGTLVTNHPITTDKQRQQMNYRERKRVRPEDAALMHTICRHPVKITSVSSQVYFGVNHRTIDTEGVMLATGLIRSFPESQ